MRNVLGIRLDAPTEAALDRHARAVGRPKSVIARDWIVERLERESVDEEMRRAAEHIARVETAEQRERAIAMSDAFSHMLDEIDGGYDWGPEGPPPFR